MMGVRVWLGEFGGGPGEGRRGRGVGRGEEMGEGQGLCIYVAPLSRFSCVTTLLFDNCPNYF